MLLRVCLSPTGWGRRGQSPLVDLADLFVARILPIEISIGRFSTSHTSYLIHTVCTQYSLGLVVDQGRWQESDRV